MYAFDRKRIIDVARVKRDLRRDGGNGPEMKEGKLLDLTSQSCKVKLVQNFLNSIWQWAQEEIVIILHIGGIKYFFLFLEIKYIFIPRIGVSAICIMLWLLIIVIIMITT